MMLAQGSRTKKALLSRHAHCPALETPRWRLAPVAAPSPVHLPASSILFWSLCMVHSTDADAGKAWLVPEGCASKHDFSATAPISHWVPTHTGWVLYTVCRRAGKGCIHRGCGSYIHCAYIYKHIYILHSYIYCTEH